nr:hypothetical protein Iba_chr07dCG13310 [Ipomoea batatas]
MTIRPITKTTFGKPKPTPQTQIIRTSRLTLLIFFTHHTNSTFLTSSNADYASPANARLSGALENCPNFPAFWAFIYVNEGIIFFESDRRDVSAFVVEVIGVLVVMVLGFSQEIAEGLEVFFGYIVDATDL